MNQTASSEDLPYLASWTCHCALGRHWAGPRLQIGSGHIWMWHCLVKVHVHYFSRGPCHCNHTAARGSSESNVEKNYSSTYPSPCPSENVGYLHLLLGGDTERKSEAVQVEVIYWDSFVLFTFLLSSFLYSSSWWCYWFLLPTDLCSHTKCCKHEGYPLKLQPFDRM